jgi:hypothetical protein
MFKQQNTLKNTAQFLIHGYQRISAFREPTCRYLPSCSEYANNAIESHGAIKGTWLSIKRLFRCHPLGNHGYDPVPPKV